MSSKVYFVLPTLHWIPEATSSRGTDQKITNGVKWSQMNNRRVAIPPLSLLALFIEEIDSFSRIKFTLQSVAARDNSRLNNIKS